MRKYFADILEEKCGFDRKMRNIKQKHNSLISSSIEIVDKLKLDYVSKSLPFYIAAIAFPNDVKKILQKSCKVNLEMKSDYVKCSNEIFNIEIALMKYSKKNLAELLNNADISVLLNHYLNKVHNSEYEEHYKILKGMSRKTIDNIQVNRDSEIKSFGAEFCEIRV